jgi:hypothetical protein
MPEDYFNRNSSSRHSLLDLLLKCFIYAEEFLPESLYRKKTFGFYPFGTQLQPATSRIDRQFSHSSAIHNSQSDAFSGIAL